MKRIFLCAVLLIAATIFGLGYFNNAPNKGQVKAAFLSENPTYQVLDVYVGEGDTDAAYFYITYRMPNDSRVNKVEWVYLRNESGEWQCQHKKDSKH